MVKFLFKLRDNSVDIFTQRQASYFYVVLNSSETHSLDLPLMLISINIHLENTIYCNSTIHKIKATCPVQSQRHLLGFLLEI